MSRIIKASEVREPPRPWRPPGADRRGAREAGEWGPSTPGLDPGAVEEAARERGLSRAIAAAEGSYRAKLERLESLTAALEAERKQFFDRVEPELVRLAVSIAEKVIGRELELRPETVVDLVRSAMKRLRDRERLRVSVNPTDLERMKEARDDLISAVDGVRKLEVVEDRRVDPGGCVIESPNGTLDARIRTQMDEIGRALGELMPESEEGDDAGPEPLPPGPEPD